MPQTVPASSKAAARASQELVWAHESWPGVGDFAQRAAQSVAATERGAPQLAAFVVQIEAQSFPPPSCATPMPQTVPASSKADSRVSQEVV